MKLYMMVTTDEYELPLYVTDSVKDLAKVSGCSVHTIHSWVSKYKRGKVKRSRFVKIEVNTKDEE